MRLQPQNLGDAVAYDYTIDIKYPSGSKIISIEHGYFDIKEGGIGDNFVKIFREAFLPNVIYPPIHIEAERQGEVVKPLEVSVTCEGQGVQV